MRKSHCSYMQDNGNGRCIADCHWNRKLPGSDCTGQEGKTMHGVNHHEARVTMAFIDGTGVEVDAQGYRVKYYVPDVTPKENLPKSWQTPPPFSIGGPAKPKANAAHLTQQYLLGKKVHP